MQTPAATPPPKTTADEHPLANILLNVLVPVLVLSYMSKDPALQEMMGKTARPWHLGPVKAIIIALALPIGYGVWHFAKTRKFNVFSGLGLASVLLTGALTLYLWNKDGSVKPNAGMFFGVKEALIPLVLGLAVLVSQRSASPLIRVFLYNDGIFDIPKIEARVGERGVRAEYDRVLRNATWLFAGSFFLSSAMNLGLAYWFFHGFEESAQGALETYNGIVAKITGWGFLVIGVPIMVILVLVFFMLVARLKKLTGLDDKELMMPR
jgi:hypothetical protein